MKKGGAKIGSGELAGAEIGNDTDYGVGAACYDGVTGDGTERPREH